MKFIGFFIPTEHEVRVGLVDGRAVMVVGLSRSAFATACCVAVGAATAAAAQSAEILTFEVGHDQRLERRGTLYVGATRRIFGRLSVHGHVNLPYSHREGREVLLGATVHLRSSSALVRPSIRFSHWWESHDTALLGLGVRVGRRVGGAVSLDIGLLTGSVEGRPYLFRRRAYLIRGGVYVKLWGPTS